MDYITVFPDTNILMHHAQELYALHDKIYICGIVLEELDRLKNRPMRRKHIWLGLLQEQSTKIKIKLTFIMRK